MNSELDIATDFFAAVFKTEVATRVMAGIISLSIFGNIFVMTYTAARGEHSGGSCRASAPRCRFLTAFFAVPQ